MKQKPTIYAKVWELRAQLTSLNSELKQLKNADYPLLGDFLNKDRARRIGALRTQINTLLRIHLSTRK